MRRAPRKDRNHALIVAAIQDAGYTVLDLAAVGDGCPDIAVGGIDRRTGQCMNWLFEIKAPGGTLTDDQIEWHATWRGPKYVVETVDQVYRILGVL